MSVGAIASAIVVALDALSHVSIPVGDSRDKAIDIWGAIVGELGIVSDGVASIYEAGTTVVGATNTVIDIDTVRELNTNYFQDSKPQIVAEANLNLLAGYRVSIETDSESSAVVECALRVNGVVVPGSQTFVSVAANEHNTATLAPIPISVSSGHALEIVAKKLSGTGAGSPVTIADGSELSLQVI